MQAGKSDTSRPQLVVSSTLATPQPSGWRPVKPYGTGFFLAKQPRSQSVRPPLSGLCRLRVFFGWHGFSALWGHLTAVEGYL